MAACFAKPFLPVYWKKSFAINWDNKSPFTLLKTSRLQQAFLESEY
jgi:hypothetical protein